MTTAYRPRSPGRRRVGELYERSFAERNIRIRWAEEAALHATQRAEQEREIWATQADEVCAPFDIDWRDLENIQVIDLLAQVQPHRNHWRWLGRTNNKGLAVVRTRLRTGEGWNTERSASVILHQLLVPGHPPPALMRAHCGASRFICVRPEHRCRVCEP